MENRDHSNELLTASAVAERLGVCTHTVRRMYKRKLIPVVRVGQTGKLIRIRLGDVLKYVAEAAA